MAFDTEFITINEVENLAINQSEFDPYIFTKYIITTQRKYVKPALGGDYYDELLTQVEGSTLTADNETIIESFIKPMLAHYVVYECYNRIHYQISNQGTMLNDTEFSRQGSSFDYSQSRNFFVIQGDNIKKQMDEYIKDVQENDNSKYPLYGDCESSTGGHSGIVIY